MPSYMSLRTCLSVREFGAAKGCAALALQLKSVGCTQLC